MSASGAAGVPTPSRGRFNARRTATLSFAGLQRPGQPRTAKDGIYTFDVLKNQGIFLADTELNKLFLVAQTGALYDDFLFWNFSGNAGQGGGDDDEEDLEGARWRSSAFMAIDGNDLVFKAAQDYVDGAFGKTGGTSGLFGALDVSDAFSYDDLFTIIKTGMDGGLLDPKAAGIDIVSLGIERDGFRNGRLAISASMADATTKSRMGRHLRDVGARAFQLRARGPGLRCAGPDLAPSSRLVTVA